MKRRDTYSQIASKLRPHLRGGLGGGVTIIQSTGGGGGGDIGDESLLLFRDGRNSLTGDLSVADGVEIDGVDLSDFWAAYGVHVLNPNAHHNRQHNITSVSDHTIAAAQYSVVGATATNTLGVLPTTTNAQSSPNTILRGDASGDLALRNLNAATITATTKVLTGLIESASNDLVISPFDDLILSPNVDVIMDTGTRIGTDNFVSGMTGWRVDYDGTADFRKIFADELTVEVFISDVNLALAGSQFIAKSLGIVSKNFTIPGSNGNLDIFDLPGFNDAQNFEDGDWVRLRFVERGTGLIVGDAWGTVNSYSDLPEGEQRWQWVRASGTVGKTINAGMVAIDYGQSGDGYIHLTSLQSNSPYLDVVTWTTDPSNPANHNVRVRLGKLDGITDTDLNPSGFGLYSDNAFLSGRIVGSEGEVVIDATYGLSMGVFTSGPNMLDWGKQFTFTTDPQEPTVENTVARIYGQRVVSSPTSNRLQLRALSGDDTGIDTAYIDISTVDLETGSAALLRASTRSDLGTSQLDLSATNANGSAGDINMIGNVRFSRALLPVGSTIDVGAAGTPFRKVYADELVVSTVTGGGTSLTGNLWQFDAGDMYIRSNSSSPRTLYVANPGGGVMSLDVEANITVGGTVDGVDLGALSSAYTSHAANPNAHHAKQHVLATGSGLGADHTISGAVAGYVLRASSSSAAAFVRLSHADLDATSLVTGNPHSMYLRKATADTIGAIHTFDTGGAPFIVGATSAGELVAGLNANQLQGYGASAFALASHNHDDRYYTEAEADARFLQGTGGELPDGSTIDGHIVWHAGNDGAGSGLDADKIHGLDLDDLDTRFGGNFLAQTGGTLTGDLIIDGDAAGPYARLALATGAGVGEQWRITGWAHDSPTVANRGDFGFSLWDGTADNLIYSIDRTAKIVNLTNTPTVGGATMWHSGNDGNGSGLDADLLQGAAGSTYLRKDVAGTITAAHTIATIEGFGPPFLLGSNNLGQKVVGFNADQLDGYDATAFATASHNHDDRYYTEAESDALFAPIGHIHESLPTPFAFTHLGEDLITVGTNGTIESADFVSGQGGYTISLEGDAEFRNLTARGTLSSTLFEYRQISVSAGDLMIADGAKLRAPFIIATSGNYIDVEDPAIGHVQVFHVGDILRIKGRGYTIPTDNPSGGSIIDPWLFLPLGVPTAPAVAIYDNWFTVTAIGDQGTHYRYSVTHNFGIPCSYPAQTTVVGYGQPTDGQILLTADDNYGPFIDMFTTGASPWDGTIPNVRVGRLDGLGIVETQQHGLAAGADLSDPDSAYLVVSNETVLLNKVEFVSKDGGVEKVRITTDGVVMLGPDVSGLNRFSPRGFLFDPAGDGRLFIGDDNSYLEWIPPDDTGGEGGLILNANINAALGLLRINDTEGFATDVGGNGEFGYTIFNTGAQAQWGKLGAGARVPNSGDSISSEWHSYDAGIILRANHMDDTYHLQVEGIDDEANPPDAFLFLQAGTPTYLDAAEIGLRGYVNSSTLEELGEIRAVADSIRIVSRGGVTLWLRDDGKFSITGLPTSSAGLTSGMIWANSGVLTVVA